MKRVIPFLPWIGALLLVAFALLAYESDLLWKVQQYNLFLDTSLFFSQKMVVPGGFLSYVSCYFTQFFFHPWLGVLILCGCWLLLMWLTKRTFRIADSWAVLALIPVATLVVADMCLGYWHYFMKLSGYFFVATIGSMAAVALLWAFRALPAKLRIVWVVLTAAVGYPLLAIIAVPLFCYRYVYYQTNFDDLWTTALPAFLVIETFPLYYIPYYILGAFFLLMVVFYQKTLTSKPLKSLYRWSLQGILIVALIVGVWHFWYKDANFHHELAMQHCIENTDWEGVILESQQVEEEPTRPIVLMRNIALSRLGRQLDEMYNYPRGTVRANTPLRVSMLYHIFGRMIYYQYGLLNDCHRICLEDGVEYGWRVELLEYMARCSLLNGETQAAKKCLNLLRHTMYHGKWADAMQQLIDHPKQIAEARETGPVTHLLHYDNALGSDGGSVEKYLMSELARQNSDDPYFQEQAVLGALWMKDSKQFMSRFSHYVRLHPHDPMPRIFQEGFYLFGKMENIPDIDKYPFDKSVKQTYAAFMKEAAKYDNQSAENGRTALWPFFGHTYFYEYFYMKYSK